MNTHGRVVLRLTLVAGLAAGLAACQVGSRIGPDEDERLEQTGADQAARMWHAQRVNKDGSIPHNALLIAKARRDRMAPAAGVTDATWTWTGPGNIGGRLRAIVIDPTDPNTMYVGSASGGVWKTTNAGASWAPLNDFVPSLTVATLVMDPTNPSTLYAGTGEGYFNTAEGSSNTAAPRGAGIFKTTDAGQTWTQLPQTATPDFYYVTRLSLAPGDPQTLLAATMSGIWRSTDGGQTWSRRTTTRTLQVQHHPTDASRAVAGRNDGVAQYTTDGGLTWTNATGITTAGATRVELAYARGTPTTVYALVSNGSTLFAYLSTNGGASFTLRSSSITSTLSSYTGAIWVDPTNANTLVVGGQALRRSTTGALSWSNAFGNVHADHHVLATHPAYNGTTNKTIYFGCDGGIYRALDAVASNTVTALNNNLGVTQCYGAAINDATGVIVMGAQDNGTNRYPGSGTSWAATFGGDGGYCASDPTDPNYFYGEVQRLNIFRSTNGGVSASYIYNNIGDASSLACNFIPYYLIDPNDPNRMLAGGQSLWRSSNIKAATPSSVTWGAIKPPLPAPLTDPRRPRPSGPGAPPPDHFEENNPINIATIAIAEGNSDLIYVGHNNGQLWKTTNGTAAAPTWTRVDTGLPGRWIGRIVIDPADTARVYISMFGYASDNVWRTTNGGQTWQPVSGSGASALPAIPVPALARHPLAPGYLLAGTDIGLFESTDDGATWAPAAPELGPVPIDELVWRNSTTLMAVTHGRGVYLGEIPPPTACYANCDASTIAPVLNVLDFNCFLNRFSAGDPYANCDGSTIPPALNVLDFNCFLNAFAAGCP